MRRLTSRPEATEEPSTNLAVVATRPWAFSWRGETTLPNTSTDEPCSRSSRRKEPEVTAAGRAASLTLTAFISRVRVPVAAGLGRGFSAPVTGSMTLSDNPGAPAGPAGDEEAFLGAFSRLATGCALCAVSSRPVMGCARARRKTLAGLASGEPRGVTHVDAGLLARSESELGSLRLATEAVLLLRGLGGSRYWLRQTAGAWSADAHRAHARRPVARSRRCPMQC